MRTIIALVLSLALTGCASLDPVRYQPGGSLYHTQPSAWEEELGPYDDYSLSNASDVGHWLTVTWNCAPAGTKYAGQYVKGTWRVYKTGDDLHYYLKNVYLASGICP